MTTPPAHPPAPHTPVMRREVLQHLSPAAGEVIVDGTFGAGGYSRAILETADCRVVGIDRDATVRPFAEALEQEFPGRFSFLAGTYAEMDALLRADGVEQVDGVVLDLGVSSMQLDTAERGFSFRQDGPLDMRMGRDGLSAAEWLNGAEERDIATILFRYGEEKAARRIARAIIRARGEGPITRTTQLTEIVHTVLGGKRFGHPDPATRTFQAIRIHVNDELRQLEVGLEAAERLLAPGGRLVVVTFHSLEDRIVKQFFNARGKVAAAPSRHMPGMPDRAREDATPRFLLLTPKAQACTDEEAAENPRARSAKLRAAQLRMAHMRVAHVRVKQAQRQQQRQQARAMSAGTAGMLSTGADDAGAEGVRTTEE